MDEEQSKVIDGTARARQWRGSRKKPRADGEATESRSDAPRTIASSLLVPAEMLPGGAPPLDADTSRVDATQPRGEVTEPAAGVSDDTESGNEKHPNPFLAAEAAVDGRGGHRSRRSPVRGIAAVSAMLVGYRDGRRVHHRQQRHRLTSRSRVRLRVSPARAAVPLAVCISAGVVIGLVILSKPKTTSVGHSAGSASRASSSLALLRPGLPESAGTAVARLRLTGHSPTRHPTRARHHRAVVSRPAHRAATPRPSPVQYAPHHSAPASTAAASSGYCELRLVCGATSPAGRPTRGANLKRQRSAPSQAFGASGALGPGSSPSG